MSKQKMLFGWLLGVIFVLGIVFRIFAFSCRDCFEDDECRLILAFLDKNFWQMFLSLGYAQSAPPFFIILTRAIGCIFGFGEKVIKIVPFLCSIVSLFVFYKLSTKILTKRVSILIAAALFAINAKLIIFSSIFKQYTTDVLVCMLCVYFFSKINIAELNWKKLTGLMLLFLLLPLCSLPSLFFIGALIIVNLLKNLKNIVFYKKLTALMLPFLIFMGLYYTFNLAPSQISLEEIFPHYWDDGFIDLKVHNLLTVLIVCFKFFFLPNLSSSCHLLLFITGCYWFVKEKNDYEKLIIAAFLLIVLASCLRLYPLCGRVSLYCIPFFILAIVKPFDVFKFKSVPFAVVVLLFFVAFSQYNASYFKYLLTKETFIDYAPKTLMQELKQKFNPQTDVVLCNSASSSSYLYYSSRMEFETDKIYEMPLYGVDDDSEIYEYLKTLKTTKKIWLYLVKDYERSKVFPAVLKWCDDQNILYKKRDRNSYLIYIEKLDNDNYL